MENTLRRYLQNGITNVIDVGATYNLLDQRATFKNNESVPSIYMTGPLLTTYESPVYENLGNDEPFTLVKSIEDGIAMVQKQLPLQPDLIKIWYITATDGLDTEASARKNLPIIKAIIDEAHKNHLKVAVHSTERITAQLAVENGCDYLVHSVDDEVLKPDFVKLFKKNKTIVCPTLIVYDGYGNTLGQNLDINDYQLSHPDPYALGTLMDLKHLSDTTLVNNYKKNINSKAHTARYKTIDSISMVNLKNLV